MTKPQVVNDQQLAALIEYALFQVTTSCIDVLQTGDSDEQLAEQEQLLRAAREQLNVTTLYW